MDCSLRFERKDLLFCLLAVVFAFFIQQGRVGSSVNGVYLSTDAAQYCAMAAATAHPEAFVKDDAYADPEAIGVHATFIVPVIAKLASDGNYGLAYLRLSGLHVAVHAITFYLLGLFLFQRRLYAALFAIIFNQAYWIYWGTYFGGGYLDYTPRTTFELFYPLYVCAALLLLRKPRWWPLFMMAFGLMVYVHSISTLPIAIGFLLGFLWMRPQGVGRARHFAWVCLCGLAFTAVIAPFVLKFLRHSVTLTSDDVAVLRQTLVARYDVEFSQYWAALGNFVIKHTLLPVFPLTAWGAYSIRRHGSAWEKDILTQMGWWTVGVLLVAALFVVDQEVALALGRHHYEFDFIRVLRFILFFCLCVILMGGVVLLRATQGQGARHRWAAALTAVLFIAIGVGGEPTLTRDSLMWYWNKRDPARYEQAYGPLLRRAAMIEALKRHTEPGATIFYPVEDQAIRHNAQRALVYGWKDASIFYYAKDAQKLRRWTRIQHALASSPTAYIDIAREEPADYILSNRPQDLPLLRELGDVVWQGDGYILVKKHSAAS